MADIGSNMTVVRWLTAEASSYADVTTDYLYARMLRREVYDDETLVSDITEKQRDLMLADMYMDFANSSSKSGTQGEADGGWSHYVAIKNVVSRNELRKMAKDLYDKWGEPFVDTTAKITMKSLYS